MPLITAAFGPANTGASVYYTILNADKTTAQARTATGVTELGSGSGTYGVEVADATLAGKTVQWDINGTTKFAHETFAAVSLATDAVNSTSLATTAVTEIWAASVRSLTVFPTIPTDASIAAAVWDEPKASHATAGTFGALLDAAPTAAAIATAVWGYTTETGRTAVQSLRGMTAALLGKLSGVSSNTPKFRDAADTKDRISATTTADGRTAVTVDLD